MSRINSDKFLNEVTRNPATLHHEQTTHPSAPNLTDRSSSSGYNTDSSAPDYQRHDNSWDIGRRLMALDHSNWQESWNPRMSMSFTNTKGLLNAPGDNNCFLNSAVQVLWHLDVFRRSFRMLSGHSCLGSNSCIFCALKVIFTQFQYSDQSSLPPDALRKALAKTFADQRRFQLGLMDDAAECFENILQQIHFHIANGESEDTCKAPHCISHQKFAMSIVEQIVCSCSASSEPLPFCQMVHYVSTSSLVNQAKSRSGTSFGELLKQALSEGDYRNCPSKCGRRVQIRRTLMNCPDVVSVGLIWDSENPSTEHIHEVVRSIGTSLRLTQLFHNVVDGRCRQGAQLQLVGIVCYYGKHYSTFFFHSKRRTWVSFDDANIKEMGSHWSAVVDKCCRGHYQPLLLLYANPDAQTVSTETAPQKTTLIKDNKLLNNNDEIVPGLGNKGYHSRQRSCDSLSGTVGGQCSLEDFSVSDSVHNTPSKDRRAVTPDPQSTSVNVITPAHRASTPGPDWGRYDSDDEGLDNRLTNHSRQPSYLTALDAVDGSSVPAQRQTQPAKYTHQGSNHNNSVDLLGSLPPELSSNQNRYNGYHSNGQYGGPQPHGINPYSGSANTNMYNQGQNSMPSYSGHYDAMYSRNSGQYTTSSQGDMYTTTSSHSGSYTTPSSHNGPYTTTSIHNGPYTTTSSHNGPYTTTSSQSSQMTTVKDNGYSAPNTPSMKRARSLEHTDPTVLPSGQAKTGISRHRPASARPYDYAHSRPMINMKSGKASEVLPDCDWAEDVLIGDFTTPDSCQPSKTQPSSWPQQQTDNDSDTYISRSTVQNVLNSQKTRNGPRSAGGIKSAAVHSSTGLESEQKQQQAWIHNQALMRDLKVDIPGDNISLGSHKDSGYRSGGSSGDRNSASSTSSTSFDSPTADSFRGFTGLYRPLGTTPHTAMSHSSSESLSSTQSGHTVKTVQGNQRLSQIPENNLSNSNCSSTLTVNKSQESLNTSQDGGLDGSTNDRTRGSQTTKKEVQAPASQTLNQYQGPNVECERLFMQAESLMESSNKQEEQSDIHSALAYCNQAIGCLQTALAIQGVSNETVVRVRMKHNSCVLRSRRLHKQILNRQLSNQSTMSTGSTQSVSSTGSSDLSLSDDSTRLSSTSSSEVHGPNRTQNQRQPNHQKFPEPSRDSSEGSRWHRPQQQPAPASHGYPQLVSGIASSRPVQGITVGKCDIARSVTDSELSKYSKVTAQDLQSAAPRSRNNSLSTDLDQDNQADARHVEIYGTLPRRKGKRSKSPAGLVVEDGAQLQPASEPSRVEVYQAYLQKQKSAAATSQPAPVSGPRAALINHSRQWSKDQIKELLLQDFVQRAPPSKPKPESIPKQQPQQHQPQRRNSYDNMLEHPPQTLGSHSRQNSYEDLLTQQTGQIAIQDLPAKKKHLPQAPVAPPSQPETSHYDYLPLRKNQPGYRPPVNQVTTQMSVGEGVYHHAVREFATAPLAQRSMSEPQPHQHPHGQSYGGHVQSGHMYPHQNMVQPHQNNVQPHQNNVQPHQNMVQPNQNNVQPHHNMVQPHQNNVQPHQNNVQPHQNNLQQHAPPHPTTTHPHQHSMPSHPNTNHSQPQNIQTHPSQNKPNTHQNMNYAPPTHPAPPKPVVAMESLQRSDAGHYSSSKVLPQSGPQKTETHKDTGSANTEGPKPLSRQRIEKFQNNGAYVKSYELQKPGEQGKPAVTETVAIKVFKPETPPKAKPAKPLKPAKPEVPKRVTSLSTFKADTPEGPGQHPDATNPPPQPPQPLSNGYHSNECDFPPPPDELLYPAYDTTDGRDPSHDRCTCGSYPGNITDGYHGNLPPYPGQQQQPAEFHPQPPGPIPVPPPSLPTSPPKPSLSKKSKRAPKARKSVSFSDNITLIATTEEVPEEIDYVAYVMNLGKGKDRVTEEVVESDEDDNTSDSMDGDYILAENTVLCTLCRKKRITPREIYCEHCCYYMSQFQPLES